MACGKFMQTAANRDYSKEWQAPGSFHGFFKDPSLLQGGHTVCGKIISAA